MPNNSSLPNNNPNDSLFEQERIARTNNDADKLLTIHREIVSNCTTPDEVVSVLRILMNKRRQNYVVFKLILNDVINNKFNNLLNVFSNNSSKSLFLSNIFTHIVEGKMYLEHERIYIIEELLQLVSDIRDKYALIANIPVETFTNVDDTKKNEFLFMCYDYAYKLGKYEECELILRRVIKSNLNEQTKYQFNCMEINLLINKLLFKETAQKYKDILNISNIDEITNISNVTVIGSYYAILSNEQTLLKYFYTNPNNENGMRDILQEYIQNGIVMGEMVIKRIKEIIERYEKDNKIVIDAQLLHSTRNHNLKIYMKYFSKIKVKELAFLMQVENNTLIKYLTEKVNGENLEIKINQNEGIIDLGKKKYNDKVEGVLEKIVGVNHKIEREMVKVERK